MGADGDTSDDADPNSLISGKIVIHNNGQALNATTTAEGMMSGRIPTSSMLAPVVERAIGNWAALGMDPKRLETLGQVDVQMADLSGSLLGMASSSNMIWIDQDAAGYGWGSSGVDLLSTVTHELGHKLDFDHGDARDLMAATLAPQTWRLPLSSLGYEYFSHNQLGSLASPAPAVCPHAWRPTSVGHLPRPSTGQSKQPFAGLRRRD